MPIHTEDFDGVTAPALPSGWTFAASLVTTTTPGGGLSPTSSPNALALPAAGNNTQRFAVYNTADSNGGDVTVTCNFAIDSTSGDPQCFGLVARGNSTSIASASGTYYWARWTQGGIVLSKVVSGTTTNFQTVLAFPDASTWYRMTLSCQGTTISLAVQRLGDGKWLNNAGSFQATQTTAISVTDSAISGAGYAGLTLQGRSDDSYADDWAFDEILSTTVYFADGGSGGDSGFPRRLNGDSGVDSDGQHRRPLASDSDSQSDASIRSLTRVESSVAGDPSLASRSLADSGATGSSTIVTNTAGGSIIVADGGSGADLSRVARLIADATAESESFRESFLVADADLGTAEDSGRATLFVGASTTAPELVSSILTAPDPTAWASDSFALLKETIKEIVGGDVTGRGTIDLGTGAESWSIATTLVVSDAAHGTNDSATGLEAAYSSRIITYAGYHVYGNTGAGDPIDFADDIAEIVGLENTTWTTPRLSPGTWSFDVRAFNPSGEEQNVDVAVTIVIDAGGSDVTNIPDPPRALSAVAQGGGKVAVHWIYPIVSGPAAPTGFRVYKGVGAVDYSTPVATVAAGTAGVIGRYTATVSGLSNGVNYAFGVRAFNGTGEESNLMASFATARSTGPNAVQSLAITASS